MLRATLPLCAAALGVAFTLPSARLLDTSLVGQALDGTSVDVSIASLPVGTLDELGVVLLSIQGATEPEARPAADLMELTLTGGERVVGEVAGGSGEVLSLRLCGDVVLPVDIGSLRSAVFAGRVPDGRAEPIEAPPELDRVYRRVGSSLDTIDGTLEEFTAEGLRFDSRRLGARLIPWGEVAALFVEVLSEGGADREPDGAPVAVDLIDGSRLRGRMNGLSSAGLDLAVGGASAIHLPMDVLAEIAVDDGRIAFLSEREPTSVVGLGNPFAGSDGSLGMSWPPRRDRAVTGGLLRAGGIPWRRGIGVQAPTTLVFDLGGEDGWRELRGAVAVDDSVRLEPAAGSVVFRIRLDGEVAWESPRLSAGDAPVAFPAIRLEGKRELGLEADMSTDLNQGDRADWLRMMLAR